MGKTQRLAVLYNNALVNLLSDFRGGEIPRECYKKVVFLGVRAVSLHYKEVDITYEEAIALFQIASLVKSLMSKLTVKELVNAFPIEKSYDGDRWQTKDYFYTRAFLEDFNEEEVIGDRVSEFMWDYVNKDMRMFNIAYISFMDNLRKFNGEPSIGEEWAEQNGLNTYHLRKDSSGKEFMYDRKNQRTIKMRKGNPNYLKVVR